MRGCEWFMHHACSIVSFIRCVRLRLCDYRRGFDKLDSCLTKNPTSLQTAAIWASSMHVSVTTSVSEPPARYSITTKSSSPTRKLKKKRTQARSPSTKHVHSQTALCTCTCGWCYLSTKLTMLGFFSSFMTRISLIISSFFGCFCRLICLMATCTTSCQMKS